CWLVIVRAMLLLCARRFVSFFFFFNATATTEIYTLSLHDALPIFGQRKHFLSRIGAADSDGAVVGAYRERSWRVQASRPHGVGRSEEHTSELQSRSDLVCRLLLEKKKTTRANHRYTPCKHKQDAYS